MNNKRNGLFRNVLFYLVIILGVIGMGYYFFGGKTGSSSQQIQSSQFITALKENNVKSYTMQPSGSTYKVTGTYRHPKKTHSSNNGLLGTGSSTNKVTSFTATVLANDPTAREIQRYANKYHVKNNAKADSSNSIWMQLLIYVAPVIFFLFFFYMMMGQAGQGGQGGRMMSFGKSKAKPIDKKKNKVRFSDVAGEEEEKQELVEVVEFLRNPR